jgi:hypothetical protein
MSQYFTLVYPYVETLMSPDLRMVPYLHNPVSNFGLPVPNLDVTNPYLNISVSDMCIAILLFCNLHIAISDAEGVELDPQSLQLLRSRPWVSSVRISIYKVGEGIPSKEQLGTNRKR